MTHQLAKGRTAIPIKPHSLLRFISCDALLNHFPRSLNLSVTRAQVERFAALIDLVLSERLFFQVYRHLTNAVAIFVAFGLHDPADKARVFTEAVLTEEPVEVFSSGKMQAEYFYMGDITEGVVCISNVTPGGQESIIDDAFLSATPYTIYNIGNNKLVELVGFIKAIESVCGKIEGKIYQAMQPRYVVKAFSDNDSQGAAIVFQSGRNRKFGTRQFFDRYHCQSDCIG